MFCNISFGVIQNSVCIGLKSSSVEIESSTRLRNFLIRSSGTQCLPDYTNFPFFELHMPSQERLPCTHCKVLTGRELFTSRSGGQEGETEKGWKEKERDEEGAKRKKHASLVRVVNARQYLAI